MHNPREIETKLRFQAIWLLLTAVFLPVLMVGIVVWMGNDEASSAQGRRSDWLLIVAVALIFSSEWLGKLPIWQRFPTVVRKNGSEIAIVIGVCAVFAVSDVDPALSGFSRQRAVVFDFVLMIAVMAAAVAAVVGVKRAWHAYKGRKAPQ